MSFAKVGVFVLGSLFGSYGIKALSSKEAKNVYVKTTAATLRAKDSVMKTVTSVREGAQDILADAKELNEQRLVEEEKIIEDKAN